MLSFCCSVTTLEPLCCMPSWNPPSHAWLKLSPLCGDVMKSMGVLEKVDPLASEKRPWARSRSLRTARTHSSAACVHLYCYFRGGTQSTASEKIYFYVYSSVTTDRRLRRGLAIN